MPDVASSFISQEPLSHELPSAYAARLASHYATSASDAHKKAHGQFFTPLVLAQHLASLTTAFGPELRLLDPGIGTGVLTCALVEHLAATTPDLTTLWLDGYELDEGVQPYAQAALDYLAEWLEARDIQCHARLLPVDFIEAHAEIWTFPLAPAPVYDLVIANPPYFKLAAADPRNALARHRQLDQPNIYALFLVQAALLTRPGGELLFLIPRSFCSGPYFERFRRFFFEHLRLDVVHLFHSRSKAFEKDAVLQENLLLKATCRQSTPGVPPDYAVRIVASEAGHDAAAAPGLEYPVQELVDFGSREQVLFLPTSEAERTLLADFKLWRHRLADFGIEVSTGPVVAFRSVPHLSEVPGPGFVPLLWIDHVRRGHIDWPNTRGRQQYLAEAGGKKVGLLPSRNYVLLRRFSAKDDQHRLIAAAYYADEWPQYAAVGLENKLNYLYARQGELSIELTTGLTALLNSSRYDAFFRIFNGNTQVSATEARALPMPELATLEELGRRMLGQELEVLDSIVDAVLFPHAMPTPAGPLFAPEPAALTPAEQKIAQSLHILQALGLPRAQLNDRSALTLLALLNLEPTGTWQHLHPTHKGVTPIMEWVRLHYDRVYAPNTRETFRRQTLHQFYACGLVLYNEDDPGRPVNSPHANYVVPQVLRLVLEQYGTPSWEQALQTYLSTRPTLVQQYAKERDMQLVPLRISDNLQLKLSAGAHSQLIGQIVTEFGPRFAPDAEVIYLGDTGAKTDYFNRERLKELGVEVDKHGKMPDVVLYFGEKKWLLLIEAVSTLR